MSYSVTLPLTPELEQWIAYALLTGHSNEIIVSQLSGHGLDPQVLPAYLDELRRSPLMAVGSEFARQLSQTKWILQLQKLVQANGHAFQSGQLPRLQAHEVERFQQDFLAANRPVIIEGLIQDWPALTNWNQTHLTSTLGEQPIQYTRYYIENNQHQPEKIQSTFAEFLNLVFDPNYTDPIYWTAYNQPDNSSPLLQSLTNDIRFPPGYCEPDPQLRTYFWIGPEGTRSGLHFDPYNVLFVQAVGSKRFLLFPPQDIPDAYLENDFFSVVDAESPDLQRFPKFAHLAPLVVDLGPGETLLIPVGWLHQVRSTSISMSVSLTCVKLPNGESNSYHPPSQFAGLL